MTTFSFTTKLTSILSTLAACTGLAVGASGCFVVADPYAGDVVVVSDPPPPADTVVVDAPAPAPAVAQLAVDANATMSYFPGRGVGLYVEYDAGGHWRVYTTCDTELSGLACDFDVIVTPEAGSYVSGVTGVNLEGGDALDVVSDGSIRLRTATAFGDQGVDFDADPGALVEIDFLLDGIAQPQFVYSVRDGQIRAGAPTNPVDFIPDAF